MWEGGSIFILVAKIGANTIKTGLRKIGFVGLIRATHSTLVSTPGGDVEKLELLLLGLRFVNSGKPRLGHSFVIAPHGACTRSKSTENITHKNRITK